MDENIQKYFEEIKNVNEKMQQNEVLHAQIEKSYEIISNAFKNGKKLLIFGNGGSAADSQHLAAEFLGQFEKKRPSLPAIALTTDSSIITAYANDYGFRYVFARQIDGLGNTGDVAIGFTTSDASLFKAHSRNIYYAFEIAKQKGMRTIGFVSQKIKILLPHLDIAIQVPHTNTAIIQGCHESIFHYICKRIDAEY